MLPSAFIPVAEKSGLIVEIGRLVWTQVCSDLTKFREKGLHSRIELYQADLLQFITETMRKYQIPGDLLEIEMTESIILNDLPFTKHFIQDLKLDKSFLMGWKMMKKVKISLFIQFI